VILVSGGSGVMGARVVQGLLRTGHPVRALVLTGDPLISRLDNVDCEIWEGDITRPDTLQGAFADVDTVYHLAAVILSRDPTIFARINCGGTQNMVDAARAAMTQHFIYVSSASVTYRTTTPYSESKLAAENIVRAQTQMRTTIVRPTLTYDDDGGEEILLFWNYLKRFPVVPFIGNGRALKRPVWVEDIVKALVAIANNPITYDKIYNLSGPEAMPIAEMARAMLECRGGPRPFVHLPEAVCYALAQSMTKLMKNPPLTYNAVAGVTQDADLDCELARRELGYDPIPFREGLAKCFPQVARS